MNIGHNQTKQLDAILLSSKVSTALLEIFPDCKDFLITDGFKSSIVHGKHFGIKTFRGMLRFTCLVYLLGEGFFLNSPYTGIFFTGNKTIDIDIDTLYDEIEKLIK